MYAYTVDNELNIVSLVEESEHGEPRNIATFNIDQDGIVTDPGKFEREHFSARLFYEDAMQSFADEEDGDSCDGPGYYWLFNLEPGDSEKYGLDAGIVGVILSEGTTGFIGMTTFTDQDTLTSTWSRFLAYQEPRMSLADTLKKILDMLENKTSN